MLSRLLARNTVAAARVGATSSASISSSSIRPLSTFSTSSSLSSSSHSARSTCICASCAFRVKSNHTTSLRSSNSASIESTFRASFASSSNPPPAAVEGEEEERILPSLSEVKRELIRSLDEEAADLGVVPDEDLSQYVQDQELRITLEKDDQIKVQKKLENYRVVVEFSSECDPDAEEKARMHDEAVKAAREQDGEAAPAEEEDEYKALQHSFRVQIRTEKSPTTGGSGFIELSCYADPGGALAVESINFEDEESSGEPNTPKDAMELMKAESPTHRLYFDDLGESAQEKLLEWLEVIGIDDTFAVFVQQYSQMVRSQKLVNKYKEFKQFLAN